MANPSIHRTNRFLRLEEIQSRQGRQVANCQNSRFERADSGDTSPFRNPSPRHSQSACSARKICITPVSLVLPCFDQIPGALAEVGLHGLEFGDGVFLGLVRSFEAIDFGLADAAEKLNAVGNEIPVEVEVARRASSMYVRLVKAQ